MPRFPFITWKKFIWEQLHRTEGAELIEFAASLPLLVVFVVGVYDFSSAFILKQKIAHIAAEAARVAANEPMSDVANGGCPASICAVRNIVDQALINNGIDDCGLGSASPTRTALTYTFSAGGCSGGSLRLKINRGYTYTATLPEPPFQANYTIEATQVTLSYPHQWQFNRVVGFIAPGANFANSAIQSVAVAQDMN
jgi:Flp pilus assembly protein TadG